MPKGPVTEGVRGSGSGRTNAQDFMVAGGGSLFCRLLCLSLSLVLGAWLGVCGLVSAVERVDVCCPSCSGLTHFLP